MQKIYLPYKISDLVEISKKYSKYYKTIEDVVKEEFILPFSYFNKHPSKSRFSESYDLLRREGNSFIKSITYAFKLLKKYNLNPAIIASCKSQKELEDYIYCLDSNNLYGFKTFKIIY